MIKIKVPPSPVKGYRYDLIYLNHYFKNEDCRPETTWRYELFCLSDRLHFWLKDNNIEYKLNENKDTCYIVFESKNDAMLFKLVFGGK